MKKSLTQIVLITLSIMLVCSCNSSKNATEATLDNVFIKNEIIVQLKADVHPRQLTVDYRKYNLETVKVVSRETHIWLFSFDVRLIEPEKMLEILRNSQFVAEAEFNKKVKLRDGKQEG